MLQPSGNNRWVKRGWHALWLCGVMGILVGCSTAKPVRISDPESFDREGGEYFVVMKDGETVRTQGLRVRDDSLYFEGGTLPVRGIARIETRSFSPVRTMGLMAGVAGAVAVAASAYLYYLAAFERASEK